MYNKRNLIILIYLEKTLQYYYHLLTKLLMKFKMNQDNWMILIVELY